MKDTSTIRVALVTSSLRLAGAEKQTVYVARALRKARIEITCFFLSQGGHYEAALRQMAIPIHQIHAPNRPWSILTQLVSALSKFRPHVVFAPQFGDLLHSGIAGRLCQALVIGGLRSDGLQELKVHGRRSPWMLRLAHGIVANSITGRNNLIAQGVAAQNIRVLPNVIDLGEFQQQSEAMVSIPLPTDRVITAVVGTLQPGKRVDRFIDALAVARRKAPQLFGVVAGADRGSRPELEDRARQSELTPDHLAFLGECPNIPALLARSVLARSAALVVCSDFEGFPNTILEAMAAGLPVITTPVGDAPLVVRHNESGYVVDGEAGRIADCMVELALSPQTRGRLGAGGKRLCAQ
jgi:glycosyltransferase involved in cell wall biosynthesis